MISILLRQVLQNKTAALQNSKSLLAKNIRDTSVLRDKTLSSYTAKIPQTLQVKKKIQQDFVDKSLTSSSIASNYENKSSTDFTKLYTTGITLIPPEAYNLYLLNKKPWY